jgi:uncharacterized protein YdgA (DUF945 family)
MGDAAKKDDEAERMERLIAANEAAANAMNRLVQLLEKREEKKAPAARVRRVHERPATAVVTDRVEALAKQALARRGTRK